MPIHSGPGVRESIVRCVAHTGGPGPSVSFTKGGHYQGSKSQSIWNNEMNYREALSKEQRQQLYTLRMNQQKDREEAAMEASMGRRSSRVTSCLVCDRELTLCCPSQGMGTPLGSHRHGAASVPLPAIPSHRMPRMESNRGTPMMRGSTMGPPRELVR